jgi:hypothetical protein
MNPIIFAMRHPITMMMFVVALIGGGSLAAGGYIPASQFATYLCVHAVRWHEPPAD